MISTCVHPFDPESFHYTVADFTTLQAVSYGLLSPISCFTDILLMCLYATKSLLREPPGDVILWQMIGQLVLDVGWMYPGLHFYLYQNISDGPICKMISLSSIYSVTICCGYNVALVFEIFQKISQPFSMSYDRRKWSYHLLTHGIAVLCTLSAAVTGSVGVTNAQHCFLKLTPYGQNFWLAEGPIFLLVLYEAVMLWVIGYLVSKLFIMRNKAQRLIILKLTIFVLSSAIVSAGFPGYLIMQGINHTIFRYQAGVFNSSRGQLDLIASRWENFGVLMGCVAGLLLSTLRMMDYVHSSRKSREIEQAKEGNEGSVNGDEGPNVHAEYSTLYSNILNESLKSALLSLHLIFSLKSLSFSSKPVLALIATKGCPGQAKRALWELRRVHLQQVLGPIKGYGDLYCVYKAGVMEYFPDYFEGIREKLGLNCEVMKGSFSPLENLATMEAHAGNKGGRSTAFLYFTYDRRLLIKTLKQSELHYLQKTFTNMHRYYLSKEGEKSLIARPLGMYTLYFTWCRAIHVAIFENVMPPASTLSHIFDLKGSTVNRNTLPLTTPISALSDLPSGPIYKELDLKRSGKLIGVSAATYQMVIKQVVRDSELLRNMRSMDYSLLLGLSRLECDQIPGHLAARAVVDQLSSNVCYLAIIDYAQKYTMRKRLEKITKRISTPRLPVEAHSCVDPDLYQSRFVEFVKSLFTVVDSQAEPQEPVEAI